MYTEKTRYTDSYRSLCRSCIDHTSLNESDTEETIRTLVLDCLRLGSPRPAAICVYPRFVRLVYQLLKDHGEADKRGKKTKKGEDWEEPQGLLSTQGQDILFHQGKPAIAAVVNFPLGDQTPEKVAQDAAEAVREGATEIDVVIPYRLFLQNTSQDYTKASKCTMDFIATVRSAIDDQVECTEKGILDPTISPPAHRRPPSYNRVLLKAILETGELVDEMRIRAAAKAVILQGKTDFLKTSTGKTPVNATPEAVKILAQVILEHCYQEPTTKSPPRKWIGIKVAGGVKTLSDVKIYLDVLQDCWAGKIIGGKIDKQVFRIGSSSLLHNCSIHAGTREQNDHPNVQSFQTTSK